MQDDQTKQIFITKFADNNEVSIFTEVTLFFANKEFHLRISFSLDITNYNTTRKRLDAITAENITDRIKEILAYIRQNMNNAQQAIIEQINKYRQNVIFKIDDSLFLSSKNIIIKRSYKKLNNKKFDLFKIIALINLSYKLRLSKIIRIFNIFHSNLLILIIINSLFN